MGSGKTQLARDFELSFARLGYSAALINFADPLKAAMRELFMFSDDQLEGHGKDQYDGRWGKAPREIMQAIGTDYCRNTIGSRFFIRHFQDRIARVDADVVIIADMRFGNEAAFVAERGGVTIKLPDGYDYNYRNHSSETSLPDEAVDVIMLTYPNIQEVDALALSIVERPQELTGTEP